MDAPLSSPLSQQSTAPSSIQSSPTAKALPPAPAQVKKPSTDVFLKDFTLVAEAAKRAQMAVLMRDLEGVALT
jgi:hypothetical protein